MYRQAKMNFRSMSNEGFVKTLPPHGCLAYRPGWLSPLQAGELFNCLHRQIDWQSRSIMLFGRTVRQPRLLCFMGDEGIRYRYSNDDYDAVAWHPAVLELKCRLQRESVGNFNSVLLNLYRHGRDSMGWHADDEPELGIDPVIASISLGSNRRFVLRCKDAKQDKLELEPEHGSLIVMSGDLQHHWQHHVPRTAHKVDARINLTFRRIHCGRRAPRWHRP